MPAERGGAEIGCRDSLPVGPGKASGLRVRGILVWVGYWSSPCMRGRAGCLGRWLRQGEGADCVLSVRGGGFFGRGSRSASSLAGGPGRVPWSPHA